MNCSKTGLTSISVTFSLDNCLHFRIHSLFMISYFIHIFFFSWMIQLSLKRVHLTWKPLPSKQKFLAIISTQKIRSFIKLQVALELYMKHWNLVAFLYTFFSFLCKKFSYLFFGFYEKFSYISKMYWWSWNNIHLSFFIDWCQLLYTFSNRFFFHC